MKELKTLEEIKTYIEHECTLIVDEPDVCYICGEPLLDEARFHQYYLADDYAPDVKFCSEKCIEEFLIQKFGINENNK